MDSELFWFKMMEDIKKYQKVEKLKKWHEEVQQCIRSTRNSSLRIR